MSLIDQIHHYTITGPAHFHAEVRSVEEVREVIARHLSETRSQLLLGELEPLPSGSIRLPVSGGESYLIHPMILSRYSSHKA